MSIEIILFGVIALVLVFDFALKGINKKNIQDDVDRIGEEQSKKKPFNFNYILARKRNILTFILLVILFKPIINFQFFTEEEEFINTEKKFPAPDKRKDFIALANINHEVVKIYKTHFTVQKFSRDKTDANCTMDNCRSYYDYIPLKSLLKRYAIKADGIEPIRTNTKGDTILFFKNNLYYDNFNQWKVIDGVNESPDYTNYIIYKENHFGEGGSISEIAKTFFTGCRRVECQLIDIVYKSKVNRNSRLFVKKSTNSRYQEIFTMIEPLILENGDFLRRNGQVIYNGIVVYDEMKYEWEIIQLLNKEGYQEVNNFDFVEVNDRYKSDSPLVKRIRSVKYSNMYMDPETKLIYSEGNQVIVEKDGGSTIFYIHPLETRKTDIKNHFDSTFKTKLWLFAVSFGSLGVLVLLFNDKIKAR